MTAGSTTVSIILRGAVVENLYIEFSGSTNYSKRSTTTREELSNGFIKYSLTFPRQDGHVYDTIKIYAAGYTTIYTGGYRQVEISNIEIRNV